MDPSKIKNLSRRQFCSSMVLAPAALASLKSLSAANQDKSKTQYDRKVKVGIIGLGHRGTLIANHCLAHGGFEIVAVADYFEEVLKKQGPILGVPENYRFSGLSGYKRVLDAGIEALLILDIPYFYPEQATVAIDAGCHVYIAKPFAIDIPGINTMQKAIRIAKNKNLVFHVDYQLPWDPANQEVANRIREGGLGHTGHIYSASVGGPWKDPKEEATIENLMREWAWLTRINLGGDDMLTYDIHIIDGVVWALENNPVSASGVSRIFTTRNGDSTDCGAVIYKFEDGVIWTHVTQALKNNSWLYNNSADFMGDQATARIGYWGDVHMRGGTKHYKGSVSDTIYQDGINANVSEFYRCIAEPDYRNVTAARAVDGTITAILGREAMAGKRHLTRDELIRENKKLEPNLSGLKV